MVLETSSYAQVETPIKTVPGVLPSKSDTISRDSRNLLKNDTTLVKTDTTKSVKKKGAIETTILYSARDSINSQVDRKIVRLYGEAKIKYGEIELEADEISIDYEESTITAHAGKDSTGKQVGYPIFMNGSEKYETKDIVYNFKTKNAKISEVRTKQGDAILHGRAIFKNEKNELFSIDNGYTTCDLEHPHYRIVSTKAKAIPGDKMVSGPFYMEFNDIPTPIGFLFGIFPSQKKSASGIIIPAYGEERNRGFFLRGGGYFFDINDYVKLEVKSDFYSKGSSGLYINSSYKKRYQYNGTFAFAYTNNVTVDKIELPKKTKDFRLTWSHSPQTRGTGRFSASVNAATATYNVSNYLGSIAANQTNSSLNNSNATLSSNISYSKTFAGTPFSMGANLRFNENLITKQVDVPFPDLNFNVNNLYPFKKVKNSMFMQNISTRLTIAATNQLTNNLGKIGNDIAKDSIAPFNFQTLGYLFKQAKKGIKSNIPIQTSFKLMKYFTVNPGISIDELMYFEKLNWGVDATGKNIVVTDTIRGFNTITNYSGTVGLTTRIYGTKFFKKTARIQAIRHVMNPSIGLTFQPDFGGPEHDYYQRFDMVNATGQRSTVYKSRHQGFVYGSSRAPGKARSLSFSLNNNIEMKVKNKTDTVARKIPLFNTLSISSSYNFAAKNYRLAPFTLSANTNILNSKVNINFSASLNPYQYIIDSVSEKGQIYQTKLDKFVWRSRFSLGKIQTASLAFSTNLNPKGQDKDNKTREKIGKSDISDSDKKFYLDNPNAYVDFTIPWNLRFSYNFTYSKEGFFASRVNQAIRFSGDISLSAKWKIDFSSGYDIKAKAITQSSLAVRRDLHCWQMSLNWVPFGKYTSYSFTIGIKSSMLRDLKLDRNRSFFDQ